MDFVCVEKGLVLVGVLLSLLLAAVITIVVWITKPCTPEEEECTGPFTIFSSSYYVRVLIVGWV